MVFFKGHLLSLEIALNNKASFHCMGKCHVLKTIFMDCLSATEYELAKNFC